MCFLAKKELFKNPLLAVLLRNLNSIPVDRSILDQSAVQSAEKALRSGMGLVVFPEGTRSKTGRLGRGKPGVGLLARRILVPIVPAHIENSKGFLKLPISERRLIIRFGKPIPTSWIESMPDTKEGYRLIAEELMKRIAELGDEQERGLEVDKSGDIEPEKKPFA
jgi:1-acyl-sn-glycerol-3-phosphate acyltransferase